jgi:hypothetical protein
MIHTDGKLSFNVLILMNVKGKGETSMAQQHKKPTIKQILVGTTTSTTMHTQTLSETIKDGTKIISAQN